MLLFMDGQKNVHVFVFSLYFLSENKKVFLSKKGQKMEHAEINKRRKHKTALYLNKA